MSGGVPCVVVAVLVLAADAGTDERAAHGLLTLRQRNGFSTSREPPAVRVSADGLHVAFTSYAQLVPRDTNHHQNVYVLDVKSRQVAPEAVRTDGDVSHEDSRAPSISGDGRYVVFESVTTWSDAPGRQLVHVFWRDRERQITRLLSVGTDGANANSHSRRPVISADGQVVVFESHATNLVEAADANGMQSDVYMTRVGVWRISRVSVSTDGRQALRGHSLTPAVSADGRAIAFTSHADLTCRAAPACQAEERDTNGMADIYVRDLEAGRTTRVSVSAKGGDANGASYYPSITADGRLVAFASEASNLTSGDKNRHADIYVRDSVSATTELVSRRPDRNSGSGASGYPTISADGSRIAFQSLAPDLLCVRRCSPAQQDINLVWDVFVLDRRAGTMVRAGDSHRWMEESRGPSLDDAGRTLAFSSRHPIDAEDRAHDEDLYIWSPVSIPQRHRPEQ